MRIHYLCLPLVALFFIPVFPQNRRPGDKPVLIRPDDEKKEKVITHDPKMAEKSLTIGDFYYKRDNYKAAEQRYREAIDYNRQWDKAYEKLVEVLAKQQKWEAALKICRMFEENNPGSDKVADFRKRAEQFESEAHSSNE